MPTKKSEKAEAVVQAEVKSEKTAASETAARKTAARKTTTKKTTAASAAKTDKPAVKKASAKKAAAAKPATKKAPAKKAPAKKSAAAKVKEVQEEIKTEARLGAEVIEAVAVLAEEPVKEQIAKEAAAAQAARAQLAAKSTAENNEARLGAEVIEAVAVLAEEPVKEQIAKEAAAAQAARAQLAAKSTAENNAQTNLSARSVKDAKVAAKGFKKPAKRKKAVKKNAVGQTPAQAAAIKAQIAAEAADGTRIIEGIAEIKGTPYAEVVKQAEAKAAQASRAMLAAKSTAENNAQTNLKARSLAFMLEGSHQTAAQRDAGVAQIAAEAADLAAKSTAENNAQTNLKARSLAFMLEGSHQTAAQRDAGVAQIAAEAADGVKVMEGIDKLGKKVEAKKVKAAKRAQELAGSDQSAAQRKAGVAQIAAEAADGVKVMEGIDSLAKKTEAKKAQAKKVKAAKRADELAGSDQTAAQRKAGVAQIAAEAADGVKVMEGIARLAEKLTPEQASRAELAAKSTAENNAQTNLSARSVKDAAVAAKGFKKPKRKKAVKKNAVGQTPAQEQAVIKQIAAEAADGTRIIEGIAEVEGTPYATTVEETKKAAAQKSREVLASRTRKVMSKTRKELTREAAAFYGTLDDQTLLEMVQAVGLDMDLDTLKNDLMMARNIDELIDSYVTQAEKSGKHYTFAYDGFDETVIPYLCNRIAANLPHKASDNAALAEKIEKDVDRILINDAFNDTAVYNDLLDDVRAVLMYGQHNHLNTLAEVEKQIPADLNKLIDRFMKVAYTILPGWQYNDVKYYEGFLYGVLTQFEDLVSLHNRAMMDVADLYIKHGDYNRGNEDYGYVLRENQLKDQIYYRFANVYAPFDLQRAKEIARDALRVVDGRYDYYPNIIEILNR